jgi:hypothetical protein
VGPVIKYDMQKIWCRAWIDEQVKEWVWGSFAKQIEISSTAASRAKSSTVPSNLMLKGNQGYSMRVACLTLSGSHFSSLENRLRIWVS